MKYIHKPFLFLFILSCFIYSGCSYKESSFLSPATETERKVSSLYLFQDTQERETVTLKVTGKIPDWVQGQLIRNGPGIIKDKNGYIKNWFDGLAKLHAFTIFEGKVTYTCKFLQCEAYKEFKRRGEFNFLGFAQLPTTNSFSFMDFFSNAKNKDITNANVNVAKINNQLVALTEIPLPVKFDKDLNTLGAFDYADNLPKNYCFESAHVVQDPDTKDTWNFLIKISVFKTTYEVYKIPHLSQERKLIATIPVSSISYMHSFSLAGRYIVLVDYPLRAKNPKNIVNGFIDAFKWSEKDPTIVYVIDKESGKFWSFPTLPFFSFHHINGFEKNNKIFVDLVAYPNADIIQNINDYPFIKKQESELCRLEIDLLKQSVKIDQPTLEHFEFPRLNETLIGKEYKYFYAVHIMKNGNGIIKYNHFSPNPLSWFQEGAYANEPVFVPHPQPKSEDDGILLSVVNDLNMNKSFLLILDAKYLTELARVEAPSLIPFGFHGKFFPNAF